MEGVGNVTNPDIVWVEHRAGPMSPEGLQVCARCGEVLRDYRNSLQYVPEGEVPMPLRGFEEHASVWSYGTNPKTWTTANPAPEYLWMPCGELT